MDLPVWQDLSTKLAPLGLEIVTVALDTDPTATTQWLDAASPTHTSLIDEGHLIDELFGIINVPNSVWIDERGMIVRPAEPAWPGSTPVLQITEMLDELPPAARQSVEHIAKMNIDPGKSLDMVMDWVTKGGNSEFALSPTEVVARSRPRSMDVATASARFELGHHLHQAGNHQAAIGHWREAHRLDPDNWTYKRQAWDLETAMTTKPESNETNEGGAYDGNWLDDVAAIGAENYYPTIDP